MRIRRKTPPFRASCIFLFFLFFSVLFFLFFTFPVRSVFPRDFNAFACGCANVLPDFPVFWISGKNFSLAPRPDSGNHRG